jgi:hypothetical protein
MPIKEDALTGGGQATAEPPPQRRKRRTKAEIEADKIAKAKIPNDDEEVTVVFVEAADGFDAGSSHSLIWPDALRLAREGKVTLSDKHEYARKRVDQEEKARLDAEDDAFDRGARIPRDDEEFDVLVRQVVEFDQTNIELGPELEASIKLEKQRRGAEAALQAEGPESEPDEPKPAGNGQPAHMPSGAAYAKPGEVALGPGGAPMIRVSSGYLEKIGLPEYSGLQIGPTQVTDYVEDRGEMIEVQTKDGVKYARKAVVDALRQCNIDAEAAMRAERQSMINFLEAVKGQSDLGGGA